MSTEIVAAFSDRSGIAAYMDLRGRFVAARSAASGAIEMGKAAASLAEFSILRSVSVRAGGMRWVTSDRSGGSIDVAGEMTDAMVAFALRTVASVCYVVSAAIAGGSADGT